MTVIDFEYADVASLKPYSRNARYHPRRQVAALARSISEFGCVNPILVNEAGEIIAGHGRLEAAVLLGMKTVPIIRVSGLSAVETRKLRLADNKLAEGSVWSFDRLKVEFEELISLDCELSLTGFASIEVDRITAPSLNAEVVDDRLPPPPAVPVSAAGDVWALGEHVLAVGDACDQASYSAALKLTGSKRADMVITDPPYNTKIAGNVSGKGRVKHQNFAMASGEMSREEFSRFLTTVLTHALDHSRDGSLHYIFSDWRIIAQLISVGEQLFTSLLNIAVWARPNGGMGSFLRSQYELCAIFKHGDAAHVNNVQLGRMGRYRSNLWQYPGASGFSKTRKKDLEDHPTVKPLAMIVDAIRDATQPGDLVLDPFGGSGTTLIAAEITGRRAALIEIDPRFADVTLRRFHGHTHIEPVLLPNRTPLSEIRLQRHVQEKEIVE